MSPRALRVVVADDERPARAFLVDLLRSCDAVHVAGEAGSGEEAVSVIQFARPDLALLDLRMPEMGGWTSSVSYPQGPSRSSRSSPRSTTTRWMRSS